jgi:hypothetical protein
MKVYIVEHEGCFDCNQTTIDGIFTSMEKALAFSEELQYDHLIYDYELDGPAIGQHVATVVKFAH